MRERHSKSFPPAIIIPPAWLIRSRPLVPPPGGGGLFEARRQGKAGGRGSGERQKGVPSFSLFALSLLERREKKDAPSSRLSCRFPFRLTFSVSRFVIVPLLSCVPAVLFPCLSCLVPFLPRSSHRLMPISCHRSSLVPPCPIPYIVPLIPLGVCLLSNRASARIIR